MGLINDRVFTTLLASQNNCFRLFCDYSCGTFGKVLLVSREEDLHKITIKLKTVGLTKGHSLSELIFPI